MQDHIRVPSKMRLVHANTVSQAGAHRPWVRRRLMDPTRQQRPEWESELEDELEMEGEASTGAEAQWDGEFEDELEDEAVLDGFVDGESEEFFRKIRRF